MTRIFIALCFLTSALMADIKSTTGQIKFDTQMDNQAEMTLNSTGLGIGITPSTNLHVNGNSIISDQLFVGGSSGSSNLNVNGTLGYGFQTVSSNTTLSNSSIVLVDSSSDNIGITLPYAGNVTGRQYQIKKISTSNSVWIFGGGNLIDDTSPIELPESNNLSSVKLISNGSKWYKIEEKDSSETVAMSNLIGWWKLDEMSGTSAYDSSGNEMFGTLNGSMTFSGNGTSGKIGRALAFDGSNDYVDFGNIYNNPIEPFTLSAWVKVPDITPASKQGIIGGAQYIVGGFFLALSELGDLEFVSNMSGGENRLKTSISSIGNNQWFFTTMTYSGSEKNIYVNGSLNNTSSTTIDLTTKSFRIGNSQQGGWSSFSGEVDDVRFYNRTLTSAEIQALYNQGQ